MPPTISRHVVAAALFAPLLGGCIGSKHTWRAMPVATEEVRVSPQEVYRRKNRLFVRVTMTNLSPSWLTVDRDAVSLQLDSGAVLGRSSGMTSRHKPYEIAPGRSHSIYVDFMDEDIDEHARAGHVFWNGAVFDGARQVAIPPTPVRARY
jgi:hypothetical protein